MLGDGEKVRIFPLLDNDDANKGYEFFTDSSELDWKILPDGKTYFDIDLSNEKATYMLQHIINLLYTGKFAFVVKKPTGTWNDNEMIFAFNRDGFLKPSEIFSQNMKISSYSTIFRGDNDKWRRLWIYPKAWTTSTYAANNDILSYLNYIKDPNQDNRLINAFMKNYMDRMEVLFPGYRFIMYNYLFHIPNSGIGDMPFKLMKYQNPELIEELISKGIIDNDAFLVAVARNRGVDLDNYKEDPRTVFLLQGDFDHILDHQRQDDRFDVYDIPTDPDSIGNFIFYAIENYPIVAKPEEGRHPGALIYKYEIRKTNNYLWVLVDPDGHIVTAYSSEF